MRYDKVCDVDNLSRALNNVYFNQCRMWANVACIENVEGDAEGNNITRYEREKKSLLREKKSSVLREKK